MVYVMNFYFFGGIMVKQQNSHLTCASCSGLTREKLVSGSKVTCEELGKQVTSKACSSYRADAFALAFIKEEDRDSVMKGLVCCMSRLNVNELQVLGSILIKEKTTRKYGFYFWQKLYFRVRGSCTDMYLNNFVEGRVLDADKTYIRVISETGKSCVQLLNEDSGSFYTIEQFKEIRRKLLRDNKLVDPKTSPEYRNRLPKIETLDFAIKANLIGDDFTKGKRVRKSEVLDLTDIVKKMASGQILNKNSKNFSSLGPQYNGDGEISIHHI